MTVHDYYYITVIHYFFAGMIVTFDVALQVLSPQRRKPTSVNSEDVVTELKLGLQIRRGLVTA